MCSSCQFISFRLLDREAQLKSVFQLAIENWGGGGLMLTVSAKGDKRRRQAPPGPVPVLTTFSAVSRAFTVSCQLFSCDHQC